MKIYILYGIFFCFSVQVTGQKNWYNYYANDIQLNEDGTKIIQNDTTLMVFSDSYFAGTDHVGISVMKIGLSGQLIWNKFFDEPLQVFTFSPCIVKSKDGNFIIAATKVDEEKSKSLVFKISKDDGALLWQTVINNDNLYNSTKCVQELDNGNIMVLLDEFDKKQKATFARKCLVTITKNGFFIKKKRIQDKANKYTQFGGFFATKIGMVMSARTMQYSLSVDEKALSCHGLDTAGTVLWHKRYHYITTGNFGYEAIQKLNDTTGVIFSQRADSVTWSHSIPILLKINTITGAVLHEKVFERWRWIYDFIIASDGNIIGVGREENDDSNLFLCKMTPNGEFIWKRHFLGSGEKFLDDANKFYSVVELKDKRIAMTGSFTRRDSFGIPDGRFINLAIVDENGCFHKNCNEELQVLAVQIDKRMEGNEFTIFPNPTNQILNLHFKEANNSNITVFNLQGQAILKQSATMDRQDYKIDVSNLENGSYFVHITQSKGKYATKKIIIQH